jgi:uncharacterized protein (TIGR00251 family)
MPCTWYRSDDGGRRLTLTLHIQPGAKRTEAAGLHGDALKIRLAATPVEGKANAALLQFLAGIFGVPLRQVTLKQGVKSRRKVVEVQQPVVGPEVLFQQAADSGMDQF